jgi:hypothetical protein
MSKPILLLLTVLILSLPSRCRTGSIVGMNTSLCLNTSYIIPLFDTKHLRMTINRTRLLYNRIRTLHISTSIADPQVAEFDHRHHHVDQIFHLTHDGKGKPRMFFL